MKPDVSSTAIAPHSSRVGIWAWSTSGAIHVTAIGTLALAGYPALPALWQALPVRDGHHSIELTASWESPEAAAVRLPRELAPNEREPTRDDASERPQPVPAVHDQRSAPPADSLAATPVEMQRIAQTPTTSVIPPATFEAGELPGSAAPGASVSGGPRRRSEGVSEVFDAALEPAAQEPPSKTLGRAKDQELRQKTAAAIVTTAVAESVEQRNVSSRASQAQPAAVRSDGAESEPLPRALFNPPPEYPPDALRERIEGRVVVRTTLDERGRVERVAVLKSSGHASLDAAALAAVRTWRFEPLGDRAAANSARTRTIAVPVRFKIESETPATP